MKDKPPFKTFDHGEKPFNSVRKTFGLDAPLPPPKKSLLEKIDLHSYKHE